MSVSIQLPDTQLEGQAAVASFLTASVLISVPNTATPWAKFVARHTGSAGFWYGSYAGGTPTATTHDFILNPGGPTQLDCPPKGNIKLLASSDANGPLDWALSYKS